MYLKVRETLPEFFGKNNDYFKKKNPTMASYRKMKMKWRKIHKMKKKKVSISCEDIFHMMCNQINADLYNIRIKDVSNGYVN